MSPELLAGTLAHFSADTHREVVGARKRPQVAFELLQELHLDDVFFGGHEIAEGNLQVGRAQRGGFRQEAVARPSGEHDEVRQLLLAAGNEAHFLAAGVYAGDPRTDRLASRSFGAVEEKPVQHLAGIDHDGFAHLEARAMPAAGNQFGGANDFFGLICFEQEGIGFDCFMREAAAARLLPGEAFVENRYVKARVCEALTAERSRRPSPDNRDFFHGPLWRAYRGAWSPERENRRYKPGAEYSIKSSCSRRGAGPHTESIGCEPLQDRKRCQACNQHTDKNLSVVEGVIRQDAREPQFQPHYEREQKAHCSGLPLETRPSVTSSAKQKMHAAGRIAAKRSQRVALSQRSPSCQLNHAPAARTTAIARTEAARSLIPSGAKLDFANFQFSDQHKAARNQQQRCEIVAVIQTNKFQRNENREHEHGGEGAYRLLDDRENG